jgi:hypothetical protein
MDEQAHETDDWVARMMPEDPSQTAYFEQRAMESWHDEIREYYAEEIAVGYERGEAIQSVAERFDLPTAEVADITG